MPFDILTSGQKPVGSYFQLCLKNDWCPGSDLNRYNLAYREFLSPLLRPPIHSFGIVETNIYRRVYH